MPTKPPDDPQRAVAVVAYRAIRDAVEPPNILDLMSICFPVPIEGPPSTVAAIRKRNIERTYDAIEWMRGQGVGISAHPGEWIDGLTTFRLSEVVTERATPVPSPTGRGLELSSPRKRSDRSGEAKSDAMGLWHGE